MEKGKDAEYERKSILTKLKTNKLIKFFNQFNPFAESSNQLQNLLIIKVKNQWLMYSIINQKGFDIILETIYYYFGPLITLIFYYENTERTSLFFHKPSLTGN